MNRECDLVCEEHNAMSRGSLPMDVGGGTFPTPSPLPEFDAFRKLVAEASKRPLLAAQQKFVKN
jgi:hypothetical protein